MDLQNILASRSKFLAYSWVSAHMYTLSREAAISYSNKTGLNPTGIASFQKSHLLKALVRHNVCNDMAEDMCIRCRVVECEPLSSILMRHSLEDIDVLQIDAEGSDWIILKTLGRMRPPVINIEWAHLNDQNRMECTEWMESNGYTHYLNRMDCLMIRENSCRHAVLSSTTTSIWTIIWYNRDPGKEDLDLLIRYSMVFIVESAKLIASFFFHSAVEFSRWRSTFVLRSNISSLDASDTCLVDDGEIRWRNDRACCREWRPLFVRCDRDVGERSIGDSGVV